jgi:hypothetical protein
VIHRTRDRRRRGDGSIRGVAWDTLSPYGFIETSVRGLDKFSLDPDGTLSIFGTGIHLRVKGVVYAIGLWRLTVELETDEVITREYHGNFDVTRDEITSTPSAPFWVRQTVKERSRGRWTGVKSPILNRFPLAGCYPLPRDFAEQSSRGRDCP